MAIYKFERRISCGSMRDSIICEHSVGGVTIRPNSSVRCLYNVVNISRKFGVNALMPRYSRDDKPLSVSSQSLEVYTHS